MIPSSPLPPLDFNAIPQWPRAHYEVDVGWPSLEREIELHTETYGLNLLPDFQRGHIWTEAQQTAYVEYCLRGGEVGKVLIFNHPEWGRCALRGEESGKGGGYVLVDGLQRLTAVRRFLAGSVPAFGRYRDQFTGAMRYYLGFKWRVLSLPTRAEVLAYYIDLNSAGTPHDSEEIKRVKGLLAREQRGVDPGSGGLYR